MLILFFILFWYNAVCVAYSHTFCTQVFISKRKMRGLVFALALLLLVASGKYASDVMVEIYYLSMVLSIIKTLWCLPFLMHELFYVHVTKYITLMSLLCNIETTWLQPKWFNLLAPVIYVIYPVSHAAGLCLDIVSHVCNMCYTSACFQVRLWIATAASPRLLVSLVRPQRWPALLTRTPASQSRSLNSHVSINSFI